jgi:Ca2+-binding RTX toxin-like protein
MTHELLRSGAGWDVSNGSITLSYGFANTALAQSLYLDSNGNLNSDVQGDFSPTPNFQEVGALGQQAIDGLLQTLNGTHYRVSLSDVVSQVNFSPDGSGTGGDIVITKAQTVIGIEFGRVLARPGLGNGGSHEGDIILNPNVAFDSNYGDTKFFTILHELGHAVGLDHPINASSLNLQKFTTMSYIPLGWEIVNKGLANEELVFTKNGLFYDNLNGQPLFTYGLQIDDIAALQEIYGVDKTTRNEDLDFDIMTTGTTYKLGQGFGRLDGNGIYDKNLAFIYTIWDAGGTTDTIDASDFSDFGAKIDLREGEFSSIGENGKGKTGYDLAQGIDINNVAIAYGTVIENAIGTGHSDTFFGNAYDNHIIGGAGDDTFVQEDAGALTFNNDGTLTLWDAYGNDKDTLDSIEIVNADSIALRNEDLVQFNQMLVAGSTFNTLDYSGVTTGQTIAYGDANKVISSQGDDTIAVQVGDGVVIEYTQGNDTYTGQVALKSGTTVTAISSMEINFSEDIQTSDVSIGSSAGGYIGTAIVNGVLGSEFHVDIVLNVVGQGSITLDNYVYREGANYSGTVISMSFADGQAFEVLWDSNAGTWMSQINTSIPINSDIFGSEALDILVGNDLDNDIRGMQGRDTLTGGVGNDDIHGGAGVDTIDGGVGSDSLNGGRGDDTIHIRDDDTAIGGQGGDVFIMRGKSGSATVEDFNIQEDRLDLSNVSDAVDVSGLNIIDDGTQVRITFDQSQELILKDVAYDEFLNNANIILGVPDPLEHAYIISNTPTTVQIGTSGFDDLYAFDSNGEALYGEDGHDNLIGDSGDDHLFGGSGWDTIFGNDGNDLLVGGDGSDYLNGNTGDDIYLFSAYDNDQGVIDTIVDYYGTDTIVVEESVVTVDQVSFTQSNFDLIINVDSPYSWEGVKIRDYFDGENNRIEFIDLGGYVYDLNYLLNNGAYSVIPSIPQFSITVQDGTAGNDILNGQAGNDRFIGGGGNDIMSGGYGRDVFIGGNGSDNMTGGHGNDFYIISGNDVSAFGTRDFISDDYGTDTLILNDIVKEDVVFTQNGNNLLIGTSDLGSPWFGVEVFYQFFNDEIGIEYIQIDGDTYDFNQVFATGEWTITPPNAAPNAFDDLITIDRGGVVAGNVLDNNGSGSDYDPDGLYLEVDALNVSGAYGTFDLTADGNFTFTGTQNYIGTHMFSYTLRDIDGKESQANITLNSIVSNNAPVTGVMDIGVSIQAGSTLSFISDFTDLDGDTITYTATLQDGSALPAYIVVDSATGNLTGTVPATSQATLAVRLIADDGFSQTNYDFDLDVYDTINGTGFLDYLHGDAGVDTIYGGYGEDRIYGNDGDDILNGERDNDRIYGHLGNDTIYGEHGWDLLLGLEGDDIIWGGIGDDVIRGDDDAALDNFVGAGNDELHGGDGKDNISGGAGDDVLYGDDGNDTLYGNADNDILYGDAGNDYLYGGLGDDTLDGGAGVDRIYGNEGNDTIHGGDGNDYLYGLDDNDTINGDAGVDRIYGNAGDDIIDGGADNDLIWGAEGADTLYGGDGADRLIGDDDPATSGFVGAGNDILYGQAGNDILGGGAGDDTLYGGTGVDALYGNDGADTFAYQAGDIDGTMDYIHDFSLPEGDMIDISDVIDFDAGNGDAISDFVFISNGSYHAQISVDQDGTGTAYSATIVTQIQSNTGLDLTTLIDNGSLIVA